MLGLGQVIQDERKFYIVMTRCSGGELFDFLQTETDVPERECKRIMREILEAVDHIHSRRLKNQVSSSSAKYLLYLNSKWLDMNVRGLIHRDIKPENIMFHDTSNEPNSPKTPASKKPLGAESLVLAVLEDRILGSGRRSGIKYKVHSTVFSIQYIVYSIYPYRVNGGVCPRWQCVMVCRHGDPRNNVRVCRHGESWQPRSKAFFPGAKILHAIGQRVHVFVV